MIDKNYKKQVKLLLSVLPEILKIESFAIYGGTAINLFVTNMLRLSVDIDLVYLKITERDEDIKSIKDNLLILARSIQKILAGSEITSLENKLLIKTRDAMIKIEANLVNRGVIAETSILPLCEKAQKEFDVFCEARIVPFGQLYGGKIIAALDRQHPRDIFDIKYLLDKYNITEEIKKGFLFSLLSSNRPLFEILSPNLIDQTNTLKNQFYGMTTESFTYKDFEETRNKLIRSVYSSLTQYDKTFIIRFSNLTPDWSVYNFQQYPSIKWKLHNLSELKKINPQKFNKQLIELEKVLNSI